MKRFRTARQMFTPTDLTAAQLAQSNVVDLFPKPPLKPLTELKAEIMLAESQAARLMNLAMTKREELALRELSGD
jgi:hypothetical protein